MYKYATLTPPILNILLYKGTEPPFTGRYADNLQAGTYLCRGCGLALFRGHNQFHSGCGWPSFDEEIIGALLKKPDQDGMRTEILCKRCHGHLGHVFTGEGFTRCNTRHCINSLAIEFTPDTQVVDSAEIILAAGCFWGVEHLLLTLPGVLLTEVGYTGGQLPQPQYEDVCTKNTGHFEAVRVVFDPLYLSLTKLLQCFFEIHDFTQTSGQGPDLGPQYRSAIFYYDQTQLSTAIAITKELADRGYKIATQLLPATTFWPAEDYHQHYYEKTGKVPYCHIRKPLFAEK